MSNTTPSLLDVSLHYARCDNYGGADLFYQDMADSENSYEITVTFDTRKIWNTRSIWSEGVRKVQEEVYRYFTTVLRGSNGWTPKLIQMAVSLEYTKKLMPHFHFRIVTQLPCDSDFRLNVATALNRQFGRTTFQLVENDINFKTYLCKDTEFNYKKYGFPHSKIYFPDNI